MKTLAHLSLVKKQPGGLTSSTGSGAFELIALTELSSAEQRRVERSLSHISPNSAIIGIQVTPRSWDIRPVIMANNEANPSLIRFLGPEVTLSQTYTGRMEALFRTIERTAELQNVSPVLAWGLEEGQIWYRRTVVDKTLREHLDQQNDDELSNVIELAREIIRAVETLQKHQIVHGHLSAENIGVSPDGQVTLLDIGVSLAVVQAASQIGLDNFPLGTSRSSFAPESLHSEKVPLSADIYGLGLVLSEVFAGVFERHGLDRTEEQPRGRRNSDHSAEKNGLRMLHDGLLALRDANPERRPTLAHIKTIIGGKGATQERPTVRAAAAGGAATVKIKRPTGTYRVVGSPSQLPQLASTVSSAPVIAPPPASAAPIANTPLGTGMLSGSKVYAAMSQARRNAEVFENEDQIDPFAGNIVRAPVPQNESIDLQNAHAEREKIARESAPEKQPRAPRKVEISVPPASGYFLWGALAAAVVIGLYVFFRSGEPTILTRPELEVAWTSKRPSQMVEVAEAAFAGDSFAEMLIISSAARNEALPSGVDTSLLRIAFDERWERELSPGDRKLALTLALSGLLGGRSPEGLPQLDSVHPGVLLGVTAAAGKNVIPFLNRIPAASLANLPPPIGLAFIELANGQPSITCGHEATRTLARFATRDIGDAEELLRFLAQNTAARLRTLAILYSQDAPGARRVLDILLNHPNLQIDHELITWARTADLLNWNEISNSDQLFVLAGIPPTEALAPENIGRAFAHPLDSIRTYAIKLALNSIKFEHPGAYNVLRELSENPTLLTPKQTVQLANFLENPQKATSSDIRTWLSSNPPPSLIASLVLATAKQSVSTRVDFEFARYLQQKGWEPSLDELRKLVEHPDKFTRFFIYSKIYALKDTNEAGQLLTGALRKEQVPEFQQQLRFMISSLNPAKH